MTSKRSASSGLPEPPEPPQWRVELHLDGLPSDRAQFAMTGHDGVSVTEDNVLQLAVVVYQGSAVNPTIPLMNAITILAKYAPHLNINAVQITRAMADREAMQWIKKQFQGNTPPWKSNSPF